MKYSSETSALVGFKRSALTLAFVTTLPAGMANAAEEVKELPVTQASTQTEDNYTVNQSTSPKYTQPLLNTAKTIAVIPQSVMLDRNVDSLRGALRNVSGITLAAGEGGTPTGDQMSIRGFSANSTIMIDGVRDIAGYTRDTFNIEAVEVAKGPSSAMYGRGATGGSINLQNKTAKLENFNDLSLRLGNTNDYRAQLDSNTQIDQTSALRINLLTDDGEVAERAEVENSTMAVALSFTTGIGTDSRFGLYADYQSQDNLPDYGLPWVSNTNTDPVPALASSEGGAPPVPFSNFYGNLQRDFEEITAQSITAKYELDLNQSTTIRSLARVGSVERQSIVTAPRFFNLAETTDVRMSDEKTRDTNDSLAVLQLDILGKYRTGSVRHDLIVGAEFAREKFERWNYVDIIDDNLDSTPVLNDLYNPNPNLAFTGQYARGDKSDNATGDTIAIYAFDTLTLNPHWQLSLGLRYDEFTTEYFYDLDGNDPSAMLEAKDQVLSWNVGAVYKPNDRGSIYFGAGNSFNPSAEDLTVASSNSGNQNELAPEDTLSYELGTKWELLEGRLFTSAALFRTEKTNALTDDPLYTSSDDPAEDRSRYDTLNGEQRVDGLEISAAGQITEKLNISAAYTLQHSEVINAEGDDTRQIGYELPRTPEHSMSLWGRYDVNEQLAVGLGAQYMGKRFNSSDPESREQADDYLIFDMMVSYQINRQWQLQLNGTNLTNEAFVDQVGGGHFIPGDGRHLTLTTRYSF